MFLISWVVLWSTTSFYSDFIVLKSGQKLEVKGPYQVQGPMMLITDPNGEIFQVPISAVDLQKTEALKASVPAPAAPAPVAKNRREQALEALQASLEDEEESSGRDVRITDREISPRESNTEALGIRPATKRAIKPGSPSGVTGPKGKTSYRPSARTKDELLMFGVYLPALGYDDYAGAGNTVTTDVDTTDYGVSDSSSDVSDSSSGAGDGGIE